MEEKKKMLEEATEKLYEKFSDDIQELIDKMDEDELLEFVNFVRRYDSDAEVYEMNEDNFNEALSGMEPYDVVNLADGFNMNCNYFSYDGWDLYEFDSLDETVDIDTVIEGILANDRYIDVNDKIRELHDDYTEQLEEIERRYAKMDREECEQKMAELARQFIAVAKEYDEDLSYLSFAYIKDNGKDHFFFYNEDSYTKGEYPIDYTDDKDKEEE